MGVAVQVGTNAGKDVTGDQCVVAFQSGDGSYGVNYRLGTTITNVSGEQFSYGHMSVPALDKDEQAPAVALLQNGPAGQIKLRTRVEFRMKSATKAAVLLCGWLAQHKHDTQGDFLESAIYDDKWLLTKYTIVGRMVYNPRTGKHYFESKPTVFNEMGYPNCLDTPYGPRFAPSHRFGYSQQYDREDYATPEPGKATNRARMWTAADIVRYFRDFYYIQGGVKRPKIGVDIGNLDLPTGFMWPEAAGNVLGSLRTIQHFRVDNTSLLDALQQTARKVGAFDVYMKPLGGFSSELTFVNMYAKANTGVSILLPSYAASGISDVLAAGDIAKWAKIIESDVNSFDNVRIVGDRTACERFCSTNFAGHGGPLAIFDAIGRLIPAWSFEDELKWKFYVQQNKGKDGYDAGNAITAANDLWPAVYCAYAIDAVIKNPFSATKWEEIPIEADRATILPQQLTGYNEDAANPRNWIPRPIKTEWRIAETANEQKAYKETQASKDGKEPWLPGPEFDGLTLSPDSKTVYFPVLRNAGMTYVIPDVVVTDEGEALPIDYTKVRARNIRANLAVCHDLPIVGAADGDPNNAAQRRSVSAPKWTYLALAEDMDYLEYLRTTFSKPMGWARINHFFATFFENSRAMAGNELFSDRPGDVKNPDPDGRIMRHAGIRLPDVNRNELSGEVRFSGIKPFYTPGMAVQIFGNGTIPCFGVIKAVTFNFASVREDQETILNFGSSEPATIYDGPSGPRSSGSTGIVNSPTDTPENPPPPDIPEEPDYPPDIPGTKEKEREKDDYEKAEDAQKAKEQPPKDKPKATEPNQPKVADKRSKAEKTRDKANDDLAKAKANYERKQAKADSTDSYEDSRKAKNAGRAARDAEKDMKRAENNAAKAQGHVDMQAGKKGMDFGWGTPGSGRATTWTRDKDGKMVEQNNSNIMNSFLGKPSSGSMTQYLYGKGKDGKVGYHARTTSDIRGGMNSIGDTRGADKFDRENHSEVKKGWDFGKLVKGGGKQGAPTLKSGPVPESDPRFIGPRQEHEIVGGGRSVSDILKSNPKAKLSKEAQREIDRMKRMRQPDDE